MLLRTRFIALLVAGMAALFTQGVMAVAPANTTLENTSTLTYGGGTTVQASVSVEVNLVKSALTILSIGNNASKAENSSYDGVYTVVSTNNGEDSYTISSVISNQVNHTAAGGASFSYAPTSPITLGATAIAVDANSTTTISVPEDGTDDDVVNGIAGGDTVRIGGTNYDVVSVDENGSGNATVTLGSAVTATVGTGVYEVKDITLTYDDVGTITDTGLNGGVGEFDIEVTFENTNADQALSTGVGTTTITVVQIGFDKYVRCVTTSDCDDSTGTGSISYDSGAGANNYYAAGVKADPGATLEYLLVVDNTSPDAITNAFLEDVLDEFTTYVLGSTLLNQGAVTDDGAGGDPNNDRFPLAPANGGIQIDDGDGDGDTDVDAGSQAYVVYQVTVSN